MANKKMVKTSREIKKKKTKKTEHHDHCTSVLARLAGGVGTCDCHLGQYGY